MRFSFRIKVGNNQRWTLALVAGAILTMAGTAFLLAGSLTEHAGGTLTGPPGTRFTLDFPKGWHVLSRTERRNLPGAPLGAVRRDKGKDLVAVQGVGPVKDDFAELSADLTKKLTEQLPGFRRLVSKNVITRAGRGLLYSYVRRPKRTVYTIVVIPAGQRSYILHAVVPSGAPVVEDQVSTMILSFDT